MPVHAGVQDAHDSDAVLANGDIGAMSAGRHDMISRIGVAPGNAGRTRGASKRVLKGLRVSLGSFDAEPARREIPDVVEVALGGERVNQRVRDR